MEDKIYTEQDLQKLTGLYESLRLDFKASALLSQDRDLIIKQLTENVSAFANTEGGVIVIGIREGKKSVGGEIDEGVDPCVMPPERLEQLIADNISPRLHGLIVRPIPLSGSKVGRLAYVVYVPKGDTAYQARKLHKYYGRSEFAAVPLEDHRIRLLMNRRRDPHAEIRLGEVSQKRVEGDFSSLQSALKDQLNGIQVVGTRKLTLPGAPRKTPDEYSDEYTFDLHIRNDGSVTIHDCVLSVSHRVSDANRQVSFAHRGSQCLFQFTSENLVSTVDHGFGSAVEKKKEAKVFPEQSSVFPGSRLTVYVPAGTAIREGTLGVLEWRLYLNDAPSVSGFVDIGGEISSGRVLMRNRSKSERLKTTL
ncbi:MAG TPA: ATP-binding protein [Verrucomicrobiae bacterium]|nr:ATP-binding protein [Verrucomicrobiae bacterium]